MLLYIERARILRRGYHVYGIFSLEGLTGDSRCSIVQGVEREFSTSPIINELLEMLSEFLEASQDVAQHRYAPAKVEAPAVDPEQRDTDILGTLKTVGGMVMVNILITLATLGIVWYNL